jgi:circadian clock protein KaiB
MANKIKKNSNSNVEEEVTVDEKYFFQLYVTGILPNSARAIKNLRAICEQYLKGRYELEIIDIYQQRSLAVKEDIIVIPVMIKKFPLPEIRLIGDLSNTQSVLEALDLL